VTLTTYITVKNGADNSHSNHVVIADAITWKENNVNGMMVFLKCKF